MKNSPSIYDSPEKLNQEIERKFLVTSLPELLNDYPCQRIEQGYLSIDPSGTEIRLRKKGNKHFQTLKTSGDKTRTEIEQEISPEFYQAFWVATAGKRIVKDRYCIPYGKHTIELDVYGGDLTGLKIAEVEFGSETDSSRFTPPAWMSEEVTENKGYKNKNLATKGIPTENLSKPKDQDKLSRISKLELKEGVTKLINNIEEKIKSNNSKPVIVEIAGGSASGKTSEVAKQVKKHFGEDAVIISMDDFYRGAKYMNEQAAQGINYNWDQPEALNIAQLLQILQELKTGNVVEKPIYDMKTSAPSEKTETVKPTKVIIVEGLFALNDAIKDCGDIKAFVDIGTHGRLLRRLLRDVERTGQKPQDILKYFAKIVQPMHEKYIEPTLKNADLIINNEYNANIEASKSGLHEIQVKYQKDIDAKVLQDLGAKPIGNPVTQIDDYYNPKDRNLIETGEILRLREEIEGGQSTIYYTYKGPQIANPDQTDTLQYREKPKIEFIINQDDRNSIRDLFGSNTTTIIKTRELYSIDGIEIACDKVSKRVYQTVQDQNGHSKIQESTHDLGYFIEVRTSTDQGVGKDQIENVIRKLGLNNQDRITKSYFEI
ncbi:MAG TPA: CYTH domain-containing protein [bacterium]|nr:CYTH domain-containing protein [bacterium]